MMGDKGNNAILDQDEAMDSYFEGLLSTLDVGADVEENSLSANNKKLLQFKAPEVENNAWQERVSAAERLEAEKAEAVRLEAEKAEAVRLEAEKAEADEMLFPNRPNWAASKFDALIGSVNNVNITFPAAAISGELEFSDDLKKMDGQPDWVLGLKMTGEDFIAVIDLGCLLLNQPVRDTNLEPYKKVLRLENSRWGVALDTVSPEVEILSSDVKWRGESPERQWLCGVQSEKQLVIVDPTKIFLADK